MNLPTAQSHPVWKDDQTLLSECEVRRQRRSGPGGQHRNKVETGIFLRHLPSGVTSEATERRSQVSNLQRALFRLRVNLSLATRSPTKKLNPSALWQDRCRGGRMHISPAHPDFPRLLAEALDVLALCDWDVPSAAEQLSCTSSQMVKLLKLEPRALKLVNQHRQTVGLHALR